MRVGAVGTNSPVLELAADGPVNQPTRSAITWPPDVVAIVKPPDDTGTMTCAARGAPLPSGFMNEAFDAACPAGKALKNPAVGAPTLVTFTATAVASALTPDGRATVVWPPGASGAPPSARVSSSRVGATGSKRPALAEVVGVNVPVTSTIRPVATFAYTSIAPSAPTGTMPELAVSLPGLEVEDRRLRPRRSSRVHRHETRARRSGSGDRDGGGRDPGGDPGAARDLDTDRGRVDRCAPTHRLPRVGEAERANGCEARWRTDDRRRAGGRDVRRWGRRDRHECHGENTDHERGGEGPWAGHERSGYGEAVVPRHVP